MIIAVVGAGGKTTLIKEYAGKCISQGKRVFVTTSTHMYIEPETILTDDAQTIIDYLYKNHFVMAGVPEGKKIKALSADTYEQVCAAADLVFVEADGSKHMPLKIPREDEPVIYDNVDVIIIVCGLHSLGKRAEEAVHRLELASKLFERNPDDMISKDTVITGKHVSKLLLKGYLEPLHQKYPNKKLYVYFNHNHDPAQIAAAGQIQEELKNETGYPCVFI